MTNRISGTRLRLAVFCGLAAATLTGTLAAPAFADDHDNRDRRWNESRRNDHRDEGRYRYYSQPEYYYSAPPVVYRPYYYQQPGASLNFSFPFH